MRAEALGLPVLTPQRPRDADFVAALRVLAPDACPVVAYGALIPGEVLAIPRLGWVNLHFSLLPAWRGAAPVQHAVMAGDDVTGATTFVLDEGLDTGPVIGRMTESLRPRDTSGEVLARLATAGAGLLVASLDALADGSAVPEPQVGDVSLAPKVSVEDARVIWRHPALAVDRRVRGCTPSPGAWTTYRGQRLGLGPVRLASVGTDLQPGEVVVTKREVLVGAGSGVVELGAVQPPGKRPMPAADWARGTRIVSGERLGDG